MFAMAPQYQKFHHMSCGGIKVSIRSKSDVSVRPRKGIYKWVSRANLHIQVK